MCISQRSGLPEDVFLRKTNRSDPVSSEQLRGILPCQAPSLPLVYPPMSGPAPPSGLSSHARPRYSLWSILPCQALSLPLVHPTPCRHTLGMWGTACSPLHQSGCSLHFLTKGLSGSTPAPGQSLSSYLTNESSSF